MKKILIIMNITILLLTSCQMTPGDTTVKSKNQDTYIDIINSAEVNNDDSQEYIANDIEKYLYEEVWNSNYRTQVNDFTVKINAQVIVPDTNDFPVYKIEPQKITQEQVDLFINKVFGENAMLYSHDDRTLVTKSEYEAIILDYQRILAQEVPKIVDSEEREKQRNFYESHIKHYLKLMESAPDEREKLLYDVTFSNDWLVEEILSQKLDPSAPEEERTSWDKDLEQEAERIKKYNTEAISFDVQKDNDIIYVDIRRSDKKYQNYFGYYSSRYKDCILSESDKNIEELSTAFESAKEIAQNFVSYLGVNYMTISNSMLGNYRNEYYCYVFIFTRNVNNTFVTYACNNISGNEYSEPWPYESIVIMVDDEGVSVMHWQSPLSQVTSKITNDAPLLEFEKIKKITEQQIEIDNLQYKWAEKMSSGAEIKSVELQIDKIVLGYMRIKSAELSGTYNLVPVWDFFGHEKVCVDVNGSEYNFVSSDRDNFGNYKHSYLTINAIDGTIIDRNIGY